MSKLEKPRFPIVVFSLFSGLFLLMIFFSWLNIYGLEGGVIPFVSSCLIYVVLVLLYYAACMKMYKIEQLNPYNEKIEFQKRREANENADREKRNAAIEESKKKLNLIIENNNRGIALFGEKFQVAEIVGFNNLLVSNQGKIDKAHLLPLVKLNEYLNTKKKSIERQVDIIINNDYLNNNPGKIVRDFSKFDVIPRLNTIERQNTYLNALHNLSIKMLESHLGGNLVLFYTIYNQFDELGVFTTEWEKRLLNCMEEIKGNLQSIDKNLLEIIDEIGNLESSVNSSISDLAADLEHRN